ncbi:MAG TPA: hypothetical protein VF110_05495 [Burkholderiales bacterium]|jgi:hypothetical protein
MRLQVSLSEEAGLLSVAVQGPYSLADFLRLADRVFAECTKRGLGRAYVDITGVTGEIPQIDRYRLGIYCAEKRDRLNRLAVVARREIINWMFENVATNRGLTTCVTADPAYATNWLRKAA